ncbi:NADP-dependent 3-hydroxy acid dehydrogenase YdfG [Roseibium hamelinense]|uniref:NADP-dependent 3-hydroxy acid dehydrogenase YdfG n=1 Tax=Roseibium hamelinense TaxID=150831 RepID=A0A562TIC1_9HYPH|nr:SDR family oxidoreductase [Roseibium hamelinense]MTI42773.1 SDR family oxidoreductase [Roseibium hamelinense]TWI93421.1 NADP-dependent 3-hydroxy acid dehydrogenase YdfG [Roseibium hamelinense]
MSVSGKVVLVTGASSGIGKATAQAFLGAGAHVVMTARRLSLLEQTAAATGTKNALCHACDVSNADEVDGLFSVIEQRFGRLDVVFNNAGNNVPAAPIDEIPVEDWLKVLNVNLHGAFLIARGAFAMMRKQQPQGGRIINNGSISAHVPRPGSVPYTTTKHAITGLTKTLSLDGRPFDIACGQIDIGNAASEMTAHFEQGLPQADGTIAPEPVMDVVHVADAVVNMAGLPLSANVQFMTLMATKMPFIARG